jgi:hypothetical protein
MMATNEQPQRTMTNSPMKKAKMDTRNHTRLPKARRIFTALAMLATATFAFGACSDGEDQAPELPTEGGDGDENLDDFQPQDENAEPACVVSEEFAACFDSCQNAAVGPANLYIMFDSSLSMEDDNKWANATGALKAFFTDPESAGLGVALRFFPATGCDEDTCDVNACSTPAVPLAALTEEPTDPQRDALIEAIDAKYPYGGTPMHPALDGAIEWAKGQLESDVVNRPVVVLVTDGAPFGCHADPDDVNADVEALAQRVATAREEHGVLTYVVGLEGSWEWIVNKIANAGGTGDALLVSNEDTYEELFAALQAIKESHVDCEVSLPAGNDFSSLDPSLVNVNYTPTGASEPVTLDQVDGSAACADNEGWYYDDPEAPTKITLCPSTCMDIQADKEAKLDVMVGCDTQVPK